MRQLRCDNLSEDTLLDYAALQGVLAGLFPALNNGLVQSLARDAFMHVGLNPAHPDSRVMLRDVLGRLVIRGAPDLKDNNASSDAAQHRARVLTSKAAYTGDTVDGMQLRVSFQPRPGFLFGRRRNVQGRFALPFTSNFSQEDWPHWQKEQLAVPTPEHQGVDEGTMVFPAPQFLRSQNYAFSTTRTVTPEQRQFVQQLLPLVLPSVYGEAAVLRQ